MAIEEFGKQRTARIPLNYFRQGDPLARWKTRFTVAALVVTAVWLASSALSSHAGRLRYSRGPVASVHATWDGNCTVCHVPFVPIGSAAWSSAGHCETCHGGPAHHASENPEHRPSCPRCHQEHRGREASLVRLPDRACTQCHQDLASHTKPGEPEPMFGNVGRFDREHHPEFHVLRLEAGGADPGKLKFNHALHLTPGMVLTEGGNPYTLAQMRDKTDRARYRRQPEQRDQAPVQLECASCHQLDSGDIRRSDSHRRPNRLHPTRLSGNYVLPITYENHCRACHPLTFDPDSPNLEAPHGLEPQEVRIFLENALSARYLADNSQLLERPVAQRPTPGNVPDPTLSTARQQIAEKIAQAEKLLYRGKPLCGECHQFETKPEGLPPIRIVPTAVPEIWFEHAIFDHASHRALRCRECHARAYPDSQDAAGRDNASRSSDDVLLPGIATCLKCHSAPGGSHSSAHGGARFDCTECHRYHNGDRPLEGRGAAARAARVQLDASQFLSGPSPEASKKGRTVP